MIGGVRDFEKEARTIMALDRTGTFSRGTRGGRNENPLNQKQSQTQPTRVKPNELLLLSVKVDDASSSHHTGKRLFFEVIISRKNGKKNKPHFSQMQ